MTRDFNKPKRDNSRPSFRDQSPNRSRDERSPRPARPRLNREMVDRAWESGAQQQHADYRPRTGGGQYRQQGQQQRNNNWRDTSNQAGYPAQNGRPNGRPSTNRQDNYRDSRDRRDTPSGNFNRPNTGNAPRSSFGQDRRNGSDQPFSDRRESFNSENRRDNERSQGFQGRGRQQRDDFRPNDRSGSFRDRPQHEESHPRWQSRPNEQRSNARDTERREYNRRPNTGGEQFEGDYEHFEERNSARTRDTRPAERPFRGSHPVPQERSRKPFESNRNGTERPARRFDDRDNDVQPERHVTRLPDGRVLKGPRPVQRRNAQFWNTVSKGTEELVSQVGEVESTTPTHEVVDNAVVEAPASQETHTTVDMPIDEETTQEEQPSVDTVSTTQQKRRTRSASAVTRGKKTAGTTTLKPSKRGFKWPTQE